MSDGSQLQPLEAVLPSQIKIVCGEMMSNLRLKPSVPLQVREFTQALFPNRTCFPLVQPMSDESQLQRLEAVPPSQTKIMCGKMMSKLRLKPSVLLQIRESIKALFPHRTCFPLVRPMSNGSQLQRLKAVPPSQIKITCGKMMSKLRLKPRCFCRSGSRSRRYFHTGRASRWCGP